MKYVRRILVGCYILIAVLPSFFLSGCSHWVARDRYHHPDQYGPEKMSGDSPYTEDRSGHN